MEFDVKKYFPKKEGFGETAISVPDLEFRASCAEGKIHALATERNAAYVLLLEAQSEIARLQAEVERLNSEIDQLLVVVDWRKDAHNDALEEAAHLIECDANAMSVSDAAAAIRALRKETK